MPDIPHRPRGVGRGWSLDAVEALERLWKEGDLSASQIAQRLGVSRNAVLGKVFRLGLSGQRAAAPPRPPRPAAPRKRPSPLQHRRTGPPPSSASPRSASCGPLETGPGTDATDAELPGLVPHLEDLAPGACHWPCGDPKAADFAFCGRRTRSPPYCAAHDRRAHRKGAGASLSQLLKLAARSA